MKHAEAFEQPPFFIPRCHANSFTEMHRVAVWTALAGLAFGAPNMPPIRPEVLGVFPHGGQRGTDVDLLIRGKNLQNTTQILFATPHMSATVLGVAHNAIRARFHLDAAAEPGRHDFRLIAWDHHTNIFPNLANEFLPELDKAYSALLEDLSERGMLDTRW
jgi:hypothetical protein